MLAGCVKKADDSAQAIAQSKELKTAEEQADYLIGQANAFLNSKEFDEAMKTARYVLSNLDQESEKAKAIIEMAKVEMQKAAESTAGDMKKTLGSLGQ
jgi:hypothetical protein